MPRTKKLAGTRAVIVRLPEGVITELDQWARESLPYPGEKKLTRQDLMSRELKGAIERHLRDKEKQRQVLGAPVV